jgi:hypothetical protein
MIAICQDLSFIPTLFFPQTAGKEYEPSPYLEQAAQHREHFTIFSGLSHPGVDGGHRADKAFLTAAPHPGRASFRNSISLDQVMANEVGHKTRFRSLSLSVNEARSLSYTQAGVEIPTIQNAASLYKKMFLQGDRQAQATQNPLQEAEPKIRRAHYRSLSNREYQQRMVPLRIRPQAL